MTLRLTTRAISGRLFTGAHVHNAFLASASVRGSIGNSVRLPSCGSCFCGMGSQAHLWGPAWIFFILAFFIFSGHVGTAPSS